MNRRFSTKADYLAAVEPDLPPVASLERRAIAERGWRTYCARTGRNPNDTGLPPNPGAVGESATVRRGWVESARARAWAYKETCSSQTTVDDLAAAQLAIWGRAPDGTLL